MSPTPEETITTLYPQYRIQYIENGVFADIKTDERGYTRLLLDQTTGIISILDSELITTQRNTNRK